MVLRIEKDSGRYRQIVRGAIRKELRKYVSRGEFIGKQGDELISIPLPEIEIPRFAHDPEKAKGVGQGEGESGTPLSPGPGDGSGAGDSPGAHIREVDVTLEELAEILGEELELPAIEPRKSRNLEADHPRYTSIRTAGPESLTHFKRSFRRALRRQMASGTYDPLRPVVIPTREDKLYKASRKIRVPESSAVVIYMMDVSGSMGDEQKEIVRITSFWIDTWLRSHYTSIDYRYVIHDAVAREVNRDTFYSTRENGGTRISSAYKLCRDLLVEEYPAEEWNVYPFHFSDGDNWGGGDTEECLAVLAEELLPRVNQFSYGQVVSPYGSGAFLKDLSRKFEDDERLSVCEIDGRDGIYDSLRSFLGKGR
jgi:uncharacterized sporulation protein YeaH/YhbH (DUF444 family)